MQVFDEESIFHQAIEIENESERNEFLDNVCKGQDIVKHRVCNLVNMHFGEGRILDETHDRQANLSRLVDVPNVGTSIGPYKLLQQIGEGGMGIVFMAQQTEPVKRKVALKVIKVGMDTRRVVARFESERQAMALMDHPCITRILDAGATPSGRPYFVMELVRGKSITRFCDDNRLSLRERLQIFVQVCNALEHAHQKGIIHRDIKPNNIMVTNQDGQPIPKIIDFGIAKAVNDPLTDKTLFTNYGEMVGTPLYMSPEQSELSEPDVDTRTDIYSLGVLLYELLTGTTPFHDLKKKSYHDICEAIRSTEPQRASTRINHLGDTVEQISINRNTDVRSLKRFIRGELDWILMKCLARDRSERYQSAGQLSAEIVRYLNGELVEAAAPTWRYRTRKFVTKHKAGVIVAGSFAALLLATTLFSSVMALKANDAQKLANARLVLVEQERDRAQAAEKQLAKMERDQRNLVAMLRGASEYNANMFKQYLANGPAINERTPGVPGPPVLQFKPIGSYWQRSPGDGSTISISSRSANEKHPAAANFSRTSSVERADFPQTDIVSEVALRGPTEGQTSKWSFCDAPENANIEVIVMSDERACEETLLKSILENQRKVFGGRDIIVARTLEQLGELTSGEQNWEQSEKYFREALEIFKESAPDKKQLAAVRLKLVKALEKQGHLKQVLDELQDLKQNFEQSGLHDEVTNLLKKINLKKDESNDSSNSGND